MLYYPFLYFHVLCGKVGHVEVGNLPASNGRIHIDPQQPSNMVEAVSVQAMIVREQVALMLAEMVADGELDETDAVFAMERVLSKNALDHLGGR